MVTRNVGILRYLINEKGASVYEADDLELALGAMEALAKAFPVAADAGGDGLDACEEDGRWKENCSGKGGGGSGGHFNGAGMRRRDRGDRGKLAPVAAVAAKSPGAKWGGNAARST